MSQNREISSMRSGAGEHPVLLLLFAMHCSSGTGFPDYFAELSGDGQGNG